MWKEEQNGSSPFCLYISTTRHWDSTKLTEWGNDYEQVV